MSRIARFLVLSVLLPLFWGAPLAARSLAHDEKLPPGVHLLRAAAPAADSAITVQLAFECQMFEGDCSKLRVLEPPAGQAQLWMSGTDVAPTRALEGEPLRDGIITLRPGAFTYVKLAYVNDSAKEIHFRAMPHPVDPAPLQQLAILNCLCVGQTYRVSPGKAWFRVIRVAAARDLPPGSRIRVTHVLTSEGLKEAKEAAH